MQRQKGVTPSDPLPVLSRILKRKTGYADMESKERFPHPHSLDDGGEMQEAPYQIRVREVSRPLLNQK
jgi:hypothetical protein